MRIFKFGFIGLGLIGGSIARALREQYPDCYIYVTARSKETAEAAVFDKVANEAVTMDHSCFSECDYIFLCAPVATNNDNLRHIAENIGPDTIITDVGSVKQPILDTITELGLTRNFIGGHPMAGSERIGYKNSNPSLLENAFYILAPTDDVSTEKVDELTSIVRTIGALPIVLEASLHDYVTGAISHLPHVISAALVNLVKNEDTDEGIMKLVAAGGFKDITRISSSSPDMWQQICLTNKENVSTLLEHYIKALNIIHEKIESSDSESLYDFFNSARTYRESFIDSNSGPIKKEYVLTVDIADEPGSIAKIAALLSKHEINIKNIGINHNREFAEGALRIEFYVKDDTDKAIRIMIQNGYSIHSKEDK